MINKRIISIVVATGLILLIPLIAMQFTEEVNWNLFDFVVMGVLLLGTGLLFEFALRQTSNMAYRMASGIALGASLLMVWMNLAVGIIGNENNPLNQLYFGVLLIGFIGAILARLRPKGMANVLFTMAGAQALVPAVALIIGKPQVSSTEDITGVVSIFILSWFFAGLFTISGLLFRRSASA